MMFLDLITPSETSTNYLVIGIAVVVVLVVCAAIVYFIKQGKNAKNK